MNPRPGMPDPHQLLELRGLIAGLCDAELTTSQVARLEEMVCADAACAAYYINAMSVYATLPQHVGIGRGTSGIKLITEWQSRDNEFWNDVVKTAAALEASVEQPRVQLEGRAMDSMERDSSTKGLVPRAKSLVRRFSELTGIPSQTTWIVLLCLTSATFALTLGWMLTGSGDQNRPPIAKDAKNLPTYVARLSKSRQVEWGQGQQPLPSQSLLASEQRVVIAAGVAEITFDSGAVTAVEGPAEFVIRSSGEGFLQRGRVIANVPPAARGFAIKTEGMRVVDLGTRFGVDVDDGQNASVHVLTGVVEAFLASTTSTGSPIRIEANRAVRYDSVAKNLGQVPVDRSRFEEIESRLSRPVITDVKASSGKPYRIVPGGLVEDALAYIDRNYEWNGSGSAGIPRELVGADYIQTSNNDDLDPDYELQITVAEPATLYVLYDDRAQTPAWLKRDFIDTGMDIGLDTGIGPAELTKGSGRSIDVQFSVWKRHVGPGTTTCGPTNQQNVAHYGVAVVAGHE